MLKILKYHFAMEIVILLTFCYRSRDCGGSSTSFFRLLQVRDSNSSKIQAQNFPVHKDQKDKAKILFGCLFAYSLIFDCS